MSFRERWINFMFLKFIVTGLVSVSFCTSLVIGQTPITQFLFDGDLLNASGFVDKNGIPAQDGTFRESGQIGTATYALGVDGTPQGALLLDCLLYTSSSPRDLTTSRMP